MYFNERSSSYKYQVQNLLPTAYCLLPTAYCSCLLPPASCFLFHCFWASPIDMTDSSSFHHSRPSRSSSSSASLGPQVFDE